MTVQMQAPVATATKCFMPDGTTYTPDGNGFVAAVALPHILYMMLSGYALSSPAGAPRSNLTATTDPLVSSDSSGDYGAGSLWFNLTGSRSWRCLSAAVGAAVWLLESPVPVGFRNLIMGGDFGANPWQRNIGGLASAGVISAAITNTVTYFADRFFAVGGASSSILMAKIADATIAGFSSALKLSRSVGNADTAVINFGQVLESEASQRLQGQQVTLSFWAKAGANFSAAAATLGVKVLSGTGSNQSAATMVSGFAGAANVVSTTQVLTASWVRYQFTGTVPAGCTQLGILLFFTPVGTAGADDSISFQGVQLEVGGVMSPFEQRSPGVELALCQRFSYALAEPANTVPVAVGSVTSTNNETFVLPLPVTMRAIPTVTAAIGTFKVNSSTGGVAAATSLAGATSTPDRAVVTAGGTGTAGQAALLQGAGGTGYVLASAEF